MKNKAALAFLLAISCCAFSAQADEFGADTQWSFVSKYRNWCDATIKIAAISKTSDPIDVGSARFVALANAARATASGRCPTAKRVQFFIGTTLAAEAALGDGWTLRSPQGRQSSAAAFYWPMVILGDPAAKRRVTFVWSAGQPQSYATYRAIVVPFITKYLEKRADTALMLLQVVTHRADLHGEGGFLLCADTAEQYRTFAIQYLLTHDVDEPLSKIPNTDFALTTSLLAIAQRYDIFSNPRACINNPDFHARLIGLLQATSDFAEKLPGEKGAVPVFLLDGKVIDVSSAKELAARLKMR